MASLPIPVLPGGRSIRTTARARRRRSTLIAYCFLAPYLVVFGVFMAAPVVIGLVVSLFNYDPLAFVQPFVGLQNYIDLVTPGTLTSADFWRSMGATGIFTAGSVPLLIVVPFAIALLLNRKMRGTTVLRTIVFAPYVLGVAVIGVIWKFLLDPQNGALNSVLGVLGLPNTIPWTVDVPWAWISLIGVTVWWTMGFNAVILLAGLQGINTDLYDAASVDGAGAWRRLTAVTLPGLRPVFTFITITSVLASANMFGQSYLITGGAPGTATRTAIMYIADQGLTQNQMGVASAMSYVLFLFLAVISVINLRLQRERNA